MFVINQVGSKILPHRMSSTNYGKSKDKNGGALRKRKDSQEERTVLLIFRGEHDGCILAKNVLPKVK
jgi:hypothetical protein